MKKNCQKCGKEEIVSRTMLMGGMKDVSGDNNPFVLVEKFYNVYICATCRSLFMGMIKQWIMGMKS